MTDLLLALGYMRYLIGRGNSTEDALLEVEFGGACQACVDGFQHDNEEHDRLRKEFTERNR